MTAMPEDLDALALLVHALCTYRVAQLCSHQAEAHWGQTSLEAHVAADLLHEAMVYALHAGATADDLEREEQAATAPLTAAQEPTPCAQ